MISYESNCYPQDESNDYQNSDNLIEGQKDSYIETITYSLKSNPATRKEHRPCTTKTTETYCTNVDACDKNQNVGNQLLECKTSEQEASNRLIYDNYPLPHRGRLKSYRPTTSLDRYRINAASAESTRHRRGSDDDGGSIVNAMVRLQCSRAADKPISKGTMHRDRKHHSPGHIGNRIELMTKIERRENSGHNGTRNNAAHCKTDIVRELIHGPQTPKNIAASKAKSKTDSYALTSAKTNLDFKERRDIRSPIHPHETDSENLSEYRLYHTTGDTLQDPYKVERFLNNDCCNAMNLCTFGKDTHTRCDTDSSFCGSVKTYACEGKCDTANNEAAMYHIDNSGARPMTVGDYTRVRLVHPVRYASSQPAIHLPRACKGSAATMTTTLPRITPASTPLPPGLSQRSHSCTSLYTTHASPRYGAYPPKELSSSLDFLQMPNRVNPLNPPPPRKRINWSWETRDPHFENEKRRLLMQKREHTRYHSAWSKPFYGAPAEKESYRRHFREVLKQQMHDKDVDKKVQLQKKVRETEVAIQQDVDCRRNDAQDYHKKHSYLMQYRDGNKNLMERLWTANKQRKVVEDRVDCERLRYNPINWSCSLK